MERLLITVSDELVWEMYFLDFGEFDNKREHIFFNEDFEEQCGSIADAKRAVARQKQLDYERFNKAGLKNNGVYCFRT